MRKELTTGPVSRRIFIFAAPMFVGQFLQQLYHVIDTIIVGNFLGKEALAAVGNSFPVIFAIISFIIGIVSGTTIIIAQYYGAKEMSQVKKAIDTLYVFIFTASIIISFVAILFSEKIFQLIQLPPSIIPLASLYFNIFIGGTILMFGFNGTNAILRGLGDSITPLFFIIGSTLLNIILNLIFILVFEWGIAGVAWATVIAQGLGFIFSLTYLNRYHHVFHLSLNNLSFRWDMLRKSLRIGIPTGFHQISVALGLMAILWIVNSFGTDVIAAYTAGARISSLAGLPPMVFGTALATFTGQNIGANKMYRVQKGLWATLAMAGSIALTASIVIFFFNQQIIALFTNDPNIIAIGSNYLLVICWFYVIFASMYIFNGQMQGSGDTFVPMLITMVIIVSRVIFAYYLSDIYGERAIWWSFPFSWTLAMILSGSYYFTGRWKKKAIVKYSTSN